MALTEKLNAIGDAIRAKTGGTDKLTLDQMPTEINGITTGGTEVEPIVLTGSCSYACSGQISTNYITLYGNTISTKDVSSSTDNMFYNSGLEYIPFDINCKSISDIQVQNTFNTATKLKEVPYINNAIPRQMNSLFYSCYSLREVPEDYFDTWDFNNPYMANNTSSYSGRADCVYQNCYSLRKTPLGWVKYMNPVINYSYGVYYCMFYSCYCLDEAVNIPVPFVNSGWTSNAFTNMFNSCHRLKRITFETNEDGSPIVVNWKNQLIDLSRNLGYAPNNSVILNYNSGITADKEVDGYITYDQLYKDPDWFTISSNFSRYDHDSAVETINSLPDASGYGSGQNIIKFEGACGSATEGGAINTLTEEEIAVAAAKGWTVTLV